MTPKKPAKPEPKPTPNGRHPLTKLADDLHASIVATPDGYVNLNVTPESMVAGFNRAAPEFVGYSHPVERRFDADGRELDANGRRLDMPTVTE